MRFGKFLSMSALLAAAAVFLSVANAQTLTNKTPLINGCRGLQGPVLAQFARDGALSIVIVLGT